jgi:hypothetical protein
MIGGRSAASAGCVASAELEVACDVSEENAARFKRAPMTPMMAAAAMMAGKGSCRIVMAQNAAAATLTNQRLCNVLPPIRQAACATIAVTAGLMP